MQAFGTLFFVIGLITALASCALGGILVGPFTMVWAFGFIVVGLLMRIAGRPAAAPAGQEAIGPYTHTRCSACKELVRRDATKCRHCGSVLTPEPLSAPTNPGPALTVLQIIGIIVVLGLIGYLGATWR